MSKQDTEKTAAKIVEALEINGDLSRTSLQRVLQLTDKEFLKPFNHLKAQGRIEYRRSLVHLRPLESEQPALRATPTATRTFDAGDAPTLDEVPALQATPPVEPESPEVPAATEAEAAGESEPEGEADPLLAEDEKTETFGLPIRMSLKLISIRRDGDTQPRAELNQDTVTEYADAMRSGDTFPPVVVFYDGQDRWLADGFHRIEAALQAQGSRGEFEARVYQGTQRDAVLYSAGVNAAHGLRRTTDDKRRAVIKLLADPEWQQWSDRKIARQCAVTHPFVAKVRQSYLETLPDSD